MKNLWPLAVAVWILFSVFSTGYDSPDEHFPTLEAAGGLLFGYWYPTWEWDQGLRSWFQPLLQAGWLWPFLKIGIQNRIWLDSLVRILNTALWWAGSRSAKKISANLGSNENESDAVGIATLLAFPFIIWGTHHGSDLFCIPFLFMALRFLTNPQSSPKNHLWFGFFSALSFQARFTTGPLLALVFISYLGFHQTKIKPLTLVFILIGFLIPFSALNALDLILYQKWSGSTHWPIFEFFKFNILESSKQFHKSPFWEPPFFFILLLLPFWIFVRKNTIRIQERWLLPPVVGMLTLWMMVRHFEFRFMIPTLALVILVIGKSKRAHWINGPLLVAAFLLYRDPHGSQVQALTSLNPAPVVFVDATGGAPVFYSQFPHTIRNLSQSEWKQMCQSHSQTDTALLLDRKIETWRNWPERLTASLSDWSKFQVISTERCPIETGRCHARIELNESLGRSLRRKLSAISSPGFVYDCEL